MPTVKFKCPDTGKMMKKQFPYNAVGKAQAGQFAKLCQKKIMVILMGLTSQCHTDTQIK